MKVNKNSRQFLTIPQGPGEVNEWMRINKKKGRDLPGYGSGVPLFGEEVIIPFFPGKSKIC
jgi:hypothetical protein